MTPDCPFCNPLQSRVISVRFYYLTSYGYLRFIWIRSAARPSSNPPVLLRPSFFLPLLRPNSSYVRPLVGFPSCLPYGLGFALTENRLHAGRLRDIRPSESWSGVLSWLPLTTDSCTHMIYAWPCIVFGFSRWGSYLYIGLTLPCSGYNLPH